MSAPKVRLTAVIMDVLDVITSSPSDDPAWGLRLCEATGYGTGTIYPALDRLMKAGWITDRWEDPPPADRPRRRFYEMTSTGREQYATALRGRQERRAVWLRSVPSRAPEPGGETPLRSGLDVRSRIFRTRDCCRSTCELGAGRCLARHAGDCEHG